MAATGAKRQLVVKFNAAAVVEDSVLRADLKPEDQLLANIDFLADQWNDGKIWHNALSQPFAKSIKAGARLAPICDRRKTLDVLIEQIGKQMFRGIKWSEEDYRERMKLDRYPEEVENRIIT